jgi:hypothetical protein
MQKRHDKELKAINARNDKAVKDAEKNQAKVLAAAVAEARKEGRQAAETAQRLQLGIDDTTILFLRFVMMSILL